MARGMTATIRLVPTRRSRDDARAERDRLIHEYVGMARRIAMKIARRSGPRVCRDEIVAAALLGLTEAADRYDATRGEPFVAFAEKRIRGAVFDELRRGDFLPRRVRQTLRRAAQARHDLEVAGTPVTDEAMARALGVTVEDYRDDIAPLAEASVRSLDAGMTEPAASWPSPAAQAETSEALGRVAAAVETLPAREARILALHYGDDLPYRAIARDLGLTASRVCQLHSRAIDQIRLATAA
jgi:RNA polymerase sigma factor FliA